jgi:hypothetical protein
MHPVVQQMCVPRAAHKRAAVMGNPWPAGRSFNLPTVVWSVFCLAMATGCGSSAPPPMPHTASSPPVRQSSGTLLPPIDLPQPSQRLGTAVVVVIDTSGSMSQTVRDHAGQQRPKHEIARAALRRIIEVTDDWHKKHSDATLSLGIMNFSGVCSNVLPMGPFDAQQAKSAVEKSPQPGGGTAIGLALEEGFKALYATGCIRKHLVCITDGDNTVATPPDLMARQLFSQTRGDVEIHFVAFDTSPQHFAFLKDVNGTVVEAADGAQLQARLVELYEKRILVEAMPAEKE